MKKVSLLNLCANCKAKIVEISGGHGLQHRLMSMNVYVDKEVTKLSHIGLRGPVVIKVGKSIIALGHGVAAKILVETE